MENKVDVSVIIAAWNSSKFINKAIDSALNQESVSIEIIIIDDASTDNTCQVIKAYQDSRIKFIQSDVNAGPGAARNIGLSVAKGTWIAILDSDDYFLPSRLQDFLSKNKNNADILIDNFISRQAGEKKTSPHYSNNELPVGPMALATFIATNLIFTKIKSTGYVKPVFRRSFLEKHKIRYLTALEIGEDYYFLLYCLANGAQAEVFNTCGYIYTIRNNSISRKMRSTHIKALLDTDNIFLSNHTLKKEEDSAQTIRTKNLTKSYQYLCIVEKIKEKKIRQALLESLKHSGAALLLWLPIKKRIFGKREP